MVAQVRLAPSFHSMQGSSWRRALASVSTTQPQSAVHRGIAFEERSLDVLQQDLSMSIRRVGGKGDGGVDFVGWWWLPHENPDGFHYPLLRRRRLRVVGQCKAEKKKIGPNYVRELEGVLFRYLTHKGSEPRSFFLDAETETELNGQSSTVHESVHPTVAVLVSQSAFTKATILHANSSSIPFCLLHLPPSQPTSSENAPDESHRSPSGNLGSVWCNPALCSANGLLKGRLEVRWERQLENAGAHPGLWWDGTRLPSWVADSVSRPG